MLSLRDAVHPDWDLETSGTGLCPGEKLYEELLIDAESQHTAHLLIYRAEERSIPRHELLHVEAALELLAELVLGGGVR